MPGRILLANEAGSGRGHVTTLKVFAQAMGSDCRYDAALCRMDHATDLAPLCDLVFQGATLGYQPAVMAMRQGRPIGNWAEFLAAIGFADEEFLTRQIDWWMHTIRARCSGLVVAEFAPCAMLAARALGVPVISIGQGHSTPPAGMAQFPAPAEGHILVHAEADLVGVVNRAGARFGLAALQYFSDIYRCDAQMPRTIAALDPYASWRSNPDYLPPMGLDCPTAGSGDEVMVYFSTTEASEPVILDAIAGVDLPMRVVMPGIGPDFAARLAARGVAVERTPLSHQAIAERSRMMVHAGQHGITCLGLALGLPQVALPCQSEQSANAACVEAMGTLVSFDQPRRDAAAITGAIRRVYADTHMARHARELAQSLRPVLLGDTAVLVRATVQRVLQQVATA
ncbi:glycosyltransferase [Devosia sp. Root635]|uniref:glycosyltransferase n=1 Tax=Devosia sp. Root635 TaxID=1736575 RepID=UPI0006FC17EA|nr:nucleotide disphospho-sugar-binding domain-containing protein [Devosia sp. Root635]KRA56054.1 hypothetical protein ASD80_01945 [Devosia sp. Root635]